MAKKPKNMPKANEAVEELETEVEVVDTNVEDETTEEVANETKQVEVKPEVTEHNVKVSDISEIVHSNLTFDNKLKKIAQISEDYKNIINVFLAYENEYNNIKAKRLGFSNKDIKYTKNVYSATRVLLSTQDLYTFKDHCDLLILLVRAFRLTSLNPFFYSSGLDKWEDEKQVAEFLAIMHTLNVIVVDGPAVALKTVNFTKFNIGKEIEAYLHTL